jgi:hypothetical protein
MVEDEWVKPQSSEAKMAEHEALILRQMARMVENE